jgi:hypothetical protein
MMRLRFAHDAFPAGEDAVTEAVDRAFADLTGVSLNLNVPEVHIPAYRVGSGISDGFVSVEWWKSTGKEILLDRWKATQHADR